MANLKDLIVNGSARILGTIYGNLSGNAATATKLAASKTVQTNLASTASASFDGSANITPGVTGTLAVGNGGTGLTASPSMLTNLGSTTAANVLQASPRPGVTGTLPIGNGGTGLTANPSMLTNLGSTAAANVLAASPRPGVTGTLAVGNGGTGQTSIANIKAGKDADGNTISSTYVKVTNLDTMVQSVITQLNNAT